MSDPVLAASIQGPLGWIDLEDAPGGYELHTDSFASRQVQLRKVEAEGEWVEGAYTTRSVRGNVVEPLVVFVTGATTYECRMRTKALTDALEQIQFGFTLTIEDYKETWSCFASEYTIEANQPLVFARKVIVRASVPHLPAVLQEQVP